MTEREYVEHIKRSASAYLARLEKGSTAEAFLRGLEARIWQNTKDSLSPATAIALCDAWLEKDQNGKADGKEG